MIVNKIIIKGIIGLLVSLIFVSCYNKNTHKEIKNDTDSHEVIGKVIDCVAVYISPRNMWPVPPPRNNGLVKVLTKSDSLKHKELILNYINEFKTIAIDTSLLLYIPDFKSTEDMFLKDKFSGFTKVYDSTETIHIDLNKIKLKKVTKTFYFDSIVYLNPTEHIGEYRDYKNIDYRFNFSKIVYNDEKSKAIIRCQYRFEDRFPNMGVFLLDKINNKWVVKQEHHFNW